MKMTPQHCISVAALAALMMFASGNASAQTARAIMGGDGRQVEVRDTSRIVTIGSAVTEIVFALGRGKDVVAVDETSTFPPSVTTKPNVGYMRALSAEGVISVSPTLIIAIEGSGPPDVIAVLSRASIPFVVVPEGHNERAVLRKIELIADVLGEEERGREMAQAVADDFRLVQSMRQRIEKRRKGVFVLAVGSGAPTVGGAKTSADGILSLGGVDNAVKDMTGFKPIVAETSLAAAPDVVFTMIERNHGLDADAMFSLPAFAATPAAREKRLIPIPSYYLNFGPRTAHAAQRLAAAVYPDLSLPALPSRPWTKAGQAERK